MAESLPCGDCVYRCEGELDQNTLKKDHVCTRYPPTSQYIPTHNGLMVMTAYPNVENGLRCGEYDKEFLLLQ